MNRHTKLPRTVRILNVVQKATELSLTGPVHGQPGIHAEQIAQELGLDRANVSKLLNNLQKSGRLIKIQGRPTLYADRECLTRHLPGTFIPSAVPDISAFRDLFSKSDRIQHPAPVQTALETQIGWDGSLETAILQAKAAVSYPPRGLHTLLVGNPGVGKSLFARQMFDYAKDAGKLPADAEFIIFNCQDHASSPQYLISRLFGYAKGAMQGNEKARKGAVEAAAGGILYINDIHKLLPKAMDLFMTLLEKNVFSRLGEASVVRQANIMVIAATTESIDSAAVLRLAQSIPVLIQLPDMCERGACELLQYLFLFFNREADAIHLPIRVHRDVLACLVSQRFQGNIGEMKSMVRIVCSHAYLACSAAPASPSSMEITCAHLPGSVLEAVRGDSPRTPELSAVLDAIESDSVVFVPGKETAVPARPTDKRAETAEPVENMDFPAPTSGDIHQMGDYILQCVTRLKSGVDAGKYDPETLVSPLIYEAVRNTLEPYEPYRCVVENRSLQYGFLLHLRSVLNCTTGGVVPSPHGADPARTNPREYALACQLRQNIAQASGLVLPDQELVLISMYLYLASKWSEESRVALLAVFHGSHVAEALAEFINSCCGCRRVCWVNFPQQMSLEALTREVVEQATRLDMGLGVLLLTDMEPLTSLHRLITERTGIRSQTLSGLSPAAMLAVAQKSMETGFTLNTPLGLSVSEPFHWKNDDCPGGALMDRIIHEILAESLTFLDPMKAAKVLLAALNELLADLGIAYSDAIAVKFIFHCSHMLERIIRNEPLKFVKLSGFLREQSALISRIEKALSCTEETFGIFIPSSELAYIAEIFIPCMEPDSPQPDGQST